MTDISTTAAASLVEVSVRKIQRMIKLGEISAIRNSKGSWRIDLSELGRVFGLTIDELSERLSAIEIRKNTSGSDKINTENLENLAVLSQEVELLKSHIFSKDEQITLLTKEKEELMQLLEQLKKQRKKKGFFAKLFS
ncbi:DNA binding domain, excisionase family [Piscirickettsia salmonis]|uniref:helix-turn-helix domain-containing protein n=1 Tax=Piscirickettsia salmonis TaxID=1238 RepID=UPI0012B88752|nr:helix-turn-helix domain-containing protein [Piscirickettsia salmonis]QGP49442.1 DNA binding domain, excisionase family [Piscirickettsia salmonis]QGP53808.1 DNA binding domain, excisionase family [Piscirickettsia salmonis]QGP60284.1 DNA binding domain, excisionase family [Piscirickettsia salmonis]QGP63392.1 DNA binding domain, excisionase family [Piscirickettsia salmonis]